MKKKRGGNKTTHVAAEDVHNLDPRITWKMRNGSMRELLQQPVSTARPPARAVYKAHAVVSPLTIIHIRKREILNKNHAQYHRIDPKLSQFGPKS